MVEELEASQVDGRSSCARAVHRERWNARQHPVHLLHVPRGEEGVCSFRPLRHLHLAKGKWFP